MTERLASCRNRNRSRIISGSGSTGFRNRRLDEDETSESEFPTSLPSSAPSLSLPQSSTFAPSSAPVNDTIQSFQPTWEPTNAVMNNNPSQSFTETESWSYHMVVGFVVGYLILFGLLIFLYRFVSGRLQSHEKEYSIPDGDEKEGISPDPSDSDNRRYDQRHLDRSAVDFYDLEDVHQSALMAPYNHVENQNIDDVYPESSSLCQIDYVKNPLVPSNATGVDRQAAYGSDYAPSKVSLHAIATPSWINPPPLQMNLGPNGSQARAPEDDFGSRSKFTSMGSFMASASGSGSYDADRQNLLNFHDSREIDGSQRLESDEVIKVKRDSGASLDKHMYSFLSGEDNKEA